MKRRLFQAGAEAKRGVALIVVLGFLSLMIMMAVAFLTQARTERLVANSTLEAQRGRQLVRTALTAAMNDYSADLFGQKLLLPPANLAVYPSIAPTAATDMGRNLGQDRIRLMAGEAQRWLPRRYLTADVSNTVAGAEWIVVREDPTAPNSRVLGRYAYACFDMSGGIDANLIALNPGASSDGIKTNWPSHPVARSSVRDVGLGELPETADAGEFKRLRLGWHAFDNLAELIMLTNGKYNGGEQEYEDEDDERVMWGPPAPGARRWRDPDRIEGLYGGPALLSSKVTDLTPYSMSAYRGVYNFATASWTPPMLCNAVADWATALAPVNAQLVNPADTVKAIADYFDDNSAAQGNTPDYPSVEAVPMLNEIKMDYRLRHVPVVGPPGGPGNLYLDVTFEFEMWYPFPSEDNEPSASFVIPPPSIGGGYIESAGANDMFIRCAVMNPAPDPATVLSSPTVSAGPVSFVPDVNNGKPKAVGTMTYTYEVLSVNVSSTCHLAVQRIYTLPGKTIRVELGGNKVDQMEFQANVSWSLAPSDIRTISYEVDDPRLNHVKARWTLANAPNLGQVNGSASAAGYGVAGGEGLYMYCRNGPMATPAELGFITTGKPWNTIDLCTPEGTDMLAMLVTDTNTTIAIAASGTFYTNGTINPSTSSTNVLRAAFSKLMKREVPNVPDMPGPNDGELDSPTALELANSMIFESQSKKIQAAGGAFMSGSAWARVPAMTAGGVLSGLGLNKNQRESLIRNTWGLFSPNNSMFTVLVIGQAIKEGPGQAGDLNLDTGEDMITGERRGVALVWRDPFPSTGGFHHEMFVRMFKFLDE